MILQRLRFRCLLLVPFPRLRVVEVVRIRIEQVRGGLAPSRRDDAAEQKKCDQNTLGFSFEVHIWPFHYWNVFVLPEESVTSSTELPRRSLYVNTSTFPDTVKVNFPGVSEKVPLSIRPPGWISLYAPFHPELDFLTDVN